MSTRERSESKCLLEKGKCEGCHSGGLVKVLSQFGGGVEFWIRCECIREVSV